MRNGVEDEELMNDVYENGAVKDIMMTDRYPINDMEYPLPHNITLPDSSRYVGTINYSKSASASDYNDVLNYNLRTNNLLEYYKNTISFCKNNDLTFSLATQIHTYEFSLLKYPGSKSLREPTNEEISLQVYLGMAYGASQIIHFLFYSDPPKITASGDSLHLWGMLNEGFDPNVGRRIYNYYGQNKWAGMMKLDSSIINLGKFIYNENKLIHNETRTVDRDGLPFQYISDILSIYRHPSTFGFTMDNADPLLKRYWEIGIFDAPDVVDKSKYFLAVNKRCTPEDSAANGDLRNLRVKFDSSQLTIFRNWKITDVLTNVTLSTFDKNSNEFVDMGIFQPGEGRLYKLAPVMQEGGTLIADESLSGVTFSCNGDVDNNGKNISVYVGTNINFADGVKWNIDGGEFKSGLFPDSPNELKVNITV
ncbi:MAG TPA: hypothetical protein DCY06_07855 [Bacteroidetes bacterium]|nr:hypothetical protein [Bacteroidota bacterium]